MRTFMKPSRLWATPDAPDQDWIKPHVLWLPQHDDQVLAYFGRLREIIRQYPDVVTPIEDEDLHLTVQSVRQKTADGVRVTDGHLKNAAVAIQHELEGMPPLRHRDRPGTRLRLSGTRRDLARGRTGRAEPPCPHRTARRRPGPPARRGPLLAPHVGRIWKVSGIASDGRVCPGRLISELLRAYP